MELPDYIAFFKKKLEDLSHSQDQNSKCVYILAIILQKF